MKYQEIVSKAKNTKRHGSHKVEFRDCDTWRNDNQINLWTYWQGYQIKDIDEKGVDILLVGQDWGNPDNDRVISRIQDIQAGIDTFYETTSPTDKILAKMFKAFGIDILKNEPGIRLFKLTMLEVEELSRSNNLTAMQMKGMKGGRTTLPWAFTKTSPCKVAS